MKSESKKDKKVKQSPAETKKKEEKVDKKEKVEKKEE